MKKKATSLLTPDRVSELNDLKMPYYVLVGIEGIVPIFFHRWSTEEVDLKSNALKNSRVKKTDNLESYVYRCENGNLAIPGLYLQSSAVAASKSFPDPRSPRKSCRDLVNASLRRITENADTGFATWQYEDRRRVIIQRSAITRTRPALKEGWKAHFIFTITQPELVPPDMAYKIFDHAGKFVGIGDFRPTYGLFNVIRFDHATSYDDIMQIAGLK